MVKYDNKLDESQNLTESFLREVVEKLTASVSDVIQKQDSGHFQIHFSNGKITRIRKDVTI